MLHRETGVRVDLLGEADLPFAQLQRDLCEAIKSRPDLKRYAVFHVSERGAESTRRKRPLARSLWADGRWAQERRSEDARSKGRSSWMRLAG
jgi:hypothetical protein